MISAVLQLSCGLIIFLSYLLGHILAVREKRYEL